MIILGSDHGAVELKSAVAEHLKQENYEILDMGVFDKTSVDYPDIAEMVCKKVLESEDNLGILLCGTGIGISISANKVKGIRCALLANEYMAKMAKRHNNANVIALGGRVIGADLAVSITDAFLNAEFEGGRHQKRVDKIHKLEA